MSLLKRLPSGILGWALLGVKPAWDRGGIRRLLSLLVPPASWFGQRKSPISIDRALEQKS